LNLKPKRKAKRFEKNSCVWQLKIKVLFLRHLRRFDNFAAFNTAGANFLSLVAAGGHLNADGLQIRIEAPPRFVVCV
jgi:hypothetical protein